MDTNSKVLSKEKCRIQGFCSLYEYYIPFTTREPQSWVYRKLKSVFFRATTAPFERVVQSQQERQYNSAEKITFDSLHQEGIYAGAN
jgi:hypothetical protein